MCSKDILYNVGGIVTLLYIMKGKNIKEKIQKRKGKMIKSKRALCILFLSSHDHPNWKQ